MPAAGQNPVKDDCSKLAPTNTVSHKKLALTNSGLLATGAPVIGLPDIPKAKEIRIKVPAIAVTALFTVITSHQIC